MGTRACTSRGFPIAFSPQTMEVGLLGAAEAAETQPAGQPVREPSAWPPKRVGEAPGRCCFCSCCSCCVLLVLTAVLFLLNLAAVLGTPEAESTLMTRREVTQLDAQATCNDGSPAGYYFAPATSPSRARTWLVFLEGGGECNDAASCTTRFQGGSTGYTTKLMTSTSPPVATSVRRSGLMAPSASPFGGANVAEITYCSSDAHMGDVSASETGTPWSFRGRRIVWATLQDIVAQAQQAGNPLGPGHTLVLAGCSAGSKGVVGLCDHVADHLPSGVAVKCFADSAMDYLEGVVSPLSSGNVDPLSHEKGTFDEFYKKFVSFTNATALAKPDCPTFLPLSERWKCLYPPTAIPSITTPLFLNTNRFDAVRQISFFVTFVVKNDDLSRYQDRLGINVEEASHKKVRFTTAVRFGVLHGRVGNGRRIADRMARINCGRVG